MQINWLQTNLLHISYVEKLLQKNSNSQLENRCKEIQMLCYTLMVLVHWQKPYAVGDHIYYCKLNTFYLWGEIQPVPTTLKCAKKSKNKIPVSQLGRNLHSSPGSGLSDSQNQIQSGWKILPNLPTRWVKKCYISSTF